MQQQWLNSILVLVARNIVHEAKDECLSVKYLTINETNPAVYMLQYIQQHIHQPELLRAESFPKYFIFRLIISEFISNDIIKKHYNSILDEIV